MTKDKAEIQIKNQITMAASKIADAALSDNEKEMSGYAKDGLLTNIMRIVESIDTSIPDARRVIREAFEQDPDWKQVYVANMAVVIMTAYGAKYDRKDGEPYEISNEVATKIIDRMFEK